jgi:hypothetical protein
MAHIIADNAVQNLGSAIILQMLKDYFHEMTEKEKQNKALCRIYNKKTIKRLMKSDHLYAMTDGLNITVLRKLKENENAVKENMKLLSKDD